MPSVVLTRRFDSRNSHTRARVDAKLARVVALAGLHWPRSKARLAVVLFFPCCVAVVSDTAVPMFFCFAAVGFSSLTLDTPSRPHSFVVHFGVPFFFVTAARIQQSTSVKRKDIRKFLDGIYVSEKLNIVQDDEE